MEAACDHLDKPADRDQRRALASKLPAAALRVFALEGKHYSGCGFHWGLMKTIGGLINRLNNFDVKYTWHDLLTDEVIYEDLIENLDDIEQKRLPQVPA